MKIIIPALFFLFCNPTFAFFTERELNSVQFGPNNIVPLYESRIGELKESMGESFKAVNENGWKVIFSSLVAHELKPYGSSVSVTLDDILNDDVLDCDNYLILTAYLVEILKPTEELKTIYAGWDHGPIANHAQWFVTGTGVPLLVDPTIAFVAIADLKDVANGRVVAEERIHRFKYKYPIVGWLEGRVYNAVKHGYYKPEHMIYRYDNLQEYIQ